MLSELLFCCLFLHALSAVFFLTNSYVNKATQFNHIEIETEKEKCVCGWVEGQRRGRACMYLVNVDLLCILTDVNRV